MIPYMVGKLAPNSSHLTRGLVKYVLGRSYFRAVSYQNGDKFVTSPPSPIVELVSDDLEGSSKVQREFLFENFVVGAFPQPWRIVAAVL